MTLRFTKSALAVVVACATALVPAAAWSAPTRPAPSRSSTTSSGWLPYRSTAFTDEPGKVCSFGVHAVPFDDHEQYRTLASFPDGSPELQEYRGPLHYRYTNQQTGKSLTRDLSGYAVYRYTRSGGLQGLYLQHGGVTVPIGNPGFAAGEWVFSGQFLVNETADGTVRVQLLHARAENLCDSLG